MKSICIMREIYKALDCYETEFENEYGICLNEAMALCCLSHDAPKLSASDISEKTGMSCSQTSKVLKSVENKKMIKRSLGKTDKRQMYFTLTNDGKECLDKIRCREITIPEILKPVFERLCADEVENN